MSRTNSSSTRVRVIEGAEARAFTRQQRWELLSPYLTRNGRGCLAYSTLQDGLDYFIVDGQGYIASKTVGRIRPTTFVLGDPICDDSQLRHLLDEFLRIYADPFFAQISRQTAGELVERGFFANQCGIETWIDLRGWSLAGDDKQLLRTALNKVRKQAIEISEFSFEQANQNELSLVSEEWLVSKTKPDGETTFLARPAVYADEPNVRRFWARDGERVLGFVVFNPLFEEQKVYGYLADISRVRKSAPKGLLYAIQCMAMDWFKAEGLTALSLGLSPLFQIEDADGINSLLTTFLLTALFRFGQQFYSFRGIAENKREFRGEGRHVYIATRHKYPVVQLYRCFRVCNISPLRQIFRRRQKPQSELRTSAKAR